MCDVNTIQNAEILREEKAEEMRAERETILTGLQAAGSMAQFGMTGGLARGPSGQSALRLLFFRDYLT